jgi:DNA-binding XRE family transcriptional regulator
LAYKISKFFNLSIEDVFIFEENSEEKWHHQKKELS